MATIQRPIKTYGNRTYVAEVAAAPGNEDPILANEVDGDLDTVYAAWNGGADTVNIKDGAVTTAKLLDGAVTTAKLLDGNVTVGKLAAGSASRLRAVDGIAVGNSFEIAGSQRLLFPSAAVAYPGGDVLILTQLGGYVQANDAASQGTMRMQVFLNRAPAAQVLMADRTFLHQVWNSTALGFLVSWTFSYAGVASIASATGLSVEVWGQRTGGTPTWTCNFGNASFVGLS